MVGILTEIIFSLGLTLGVGSSTFALIFFIRALEDGVVDPTERKFLGTVFVVLRIGMALLFLGLLLSLMLPAALPLPLWLLLGVITVNAVLMDRHIMPMQYGPVLAGGSWYSLFFVSRTPLGELSLLILIPLYVAFLLVFYGVFTYLKKKFTHPKVTPRVEGVTDPAILAKYSTDASCFSLTPGMVYYPKNVADVVLLTEMCAKAQEKDPQASLTVRAGGTCMSGGPLNTGWIIDMTKYMNGIVIDPVNRTATVEMGAYFRDIEDEAAKHGLMFAPYPSSRRICGIGGMIGNNASGEKSLRLGATSDNVQELEVVLADGTVERVLPKPQSELTSPREKALLALAMKHGSALRRATGEVKKAASGYRIEKIVEGDTFSLIPLFVGAQGTLGIVTKAVLTLTPIPKYTELILISAPSLKDISKSIETIGRFNPEGLETFDWHTFKKAEEHLSDSAKLIAPYINPASHLIILAQFSERTKKATMEQAARCQSALIEAGFSALQVTNPLHVEAAWNIRRNSFLLMRDHNPEGMKAVPCIEDVIVPLPALGTFITSLRTILKKRKIAYGYHGHIGDGSLRIIPVFDFRNPNVHDEIIGLMNDVFALVKKHKGNMSADHSDGIIRSPFLKEFYGDELYATFGEVKYLFDPKNIMNPNKKIGVTLEYLKSAIGKK